MFNAVGPNTNLHKYLLYYLVYHLNPANIRVQIEPFVFVYFLIRTVSVGAAALNCSWSNTQTLKSFRDTDQRLQNDEFAY